MIPIKEYYVVDKECKNSPLTGMTVYVPRAIIKSDPPPAEILLTMQVHIAEPSLTNGSDEVKEAAE